MRDASHHREELLEVNLSIAIHINLSDGLIQLFLRVHVFELVTSQELQEFVGVDLTAAIAVEHLESRLEV